MTEQSTLLHSLVSAAREKGVDPDDERLIDSINRVTRIEEQLGAIFAQHPEIMQSDALRVAVAAGKSGELVATTVGGGALVAVSGWTGLGAVAGVASAAYGTHLAYEIGYGDAVREAIFTGGGSHVGAGLYAVLDNPDALQWLHQVATGKGVARGAISLGGAVIPSGVGQLASLGVKSLGVAAPFGSVNLGGMAIGQAAYTMAVTRDPALAAAGMFIPPSIAFIPRFAPKTWQEDGAGEVFRTMVADARAALETCGVVDGTSCKPHDMAMAMRQAAYRLGVTAPPNDKAPKTWQEDGAEEVFRTMVADAGAALKTCGVVDGTSCKPHDMAMVPYGGEQRSIIR
jgi:hypothetical protein